MQRILEIVSTTDILGIFLAISALYLIKAVVRKEKENLVKVLALFLILLAGFVYFNQTPSYKMPLSEIRDRLFPQTIPEIHYSEQSNLQGTKVQTRYQFHPPFPPLSVKMDKRGDHFIILNPESVNRVLRQMNLPDVEGSSRELSSITGNLIDANLFRWENYSKGILVLEKALCRGENEIVQNQCIQSITIIQGR